MAPKFDLSTPKGVAAFNGFISSKSYVEGYSYSQVGSVSAAFGTFANGVLILVRTVRIIPHHTGWADLPRPSLRRWREACVQSSDEGQEFWGGQMRFSASCGTPAASRSVLWTVVVHRSWIPLDKLDTNMVDGWGVKLGG